MLPSSLNTQHPYFDVQSLKLLQRRLYGRLNYIIEQSFCNRAETAGAMAMITPHAGWGVMRRWGISSIEINLF
jgi:hypothetical protein